MSLEQQLCKYIVSAHLPGEDPENVGFDDNLIDSGILDSMAIMQLVGHLEKEYGITIPTEDIDPRNFATVSTLAGMVRAKQTSV